MTKKNFNQENYFHTTEVISLSRENLNQCLELDKLSLQGFWNKSQWEFELNSSSRLCVAIKKASKIIALACGSIALDQLEITFVAVHPNSQRQGLGKKIVSYLLIQAKGLNANNAILEVSHKNIAAINLYKRLSFKQVNRRKSYYKDGSDALILSTII